MDLYKILEINNNASEIEIKKAYNKLVLKYHPDKNTDIDAREKFEKIQTAYQILSDSKTRKEYSKLNNVDKNNFMTLLQNIINNTISLEELGQMSPLCGKINKNDLEYLESNIKNLLNALNFQELFTFYNKGIFPKKKIDTDLTSSETDSEIIKEINADYYFRLPIYYEKYNNLNIQLNIKITIDDLIKKNKKEIKIKRNINGTEINNTFIINLEKPYIVFQNYGDVFNGTFGNLIIKLMLFNNSCWDENNIIIEHEISLYEMIYGVDITNYLNYNKSIKNNQDNLEFSKWIPVRDGFFIDIEIDNFNLNIKLILNYQHSNDKAKILFEYFS
jgi:curved DNA-binding protein CbpA